MPGSEFTLGEVVAKIDGLSRRVDEFKSEVGEDFARVHRRLDAGDRRFREQDKADAAETAAAEATRRADEKVKTIALKVGSWVLGVVGAVGLAALSHVPWLAEWLIPPKGH